MFCIYFFVLFSSKDDFGGLLKQTIVNPPFEGLWYIYGTFQLQTLNKWTLFSMALLVDEDKNRAWKIVVCISSSYCRPSLMTMGKVYITNKPSAISFETQHPLPSHHEGTLWRVRVTYRGTASNTEETKGPGRSGLVADTWRKQD